MVLLQWICCTAYGTNVIFCKGHKSCNAEAKQELIQEL